MNAITGTGTFAFFLIAVFGLLVMFILIARVCLYVGYLRDCRAVHMRRQYKPNPAREVVENILAQLGKPNRHRFIDEETIQFVYFILPKYVSSLKSSCGFIIWARVTIGRKFITIGIECRYDISDSDMAFARKISDELMSLESLKLKSYMLRTTVQPRPSEFGVATGAFSKLR